MIPGDQRTRAEHLAWCKERALEYLRPGPFFSVQDAATSLMSDLGKHPSTLRHPALERCFSLLATGADVDQMRAFIENVV